VGRQGLKGAINGLSVMDLKDLREFEVEFQLLN